MIPSGSAYQPSNTGLPLVNTSSATACFCFGCPQATKAAVHKNTNKLFFFISHILMFHILSQTALGCLLIKARQVIAGLAHHLYYLVETYPVLAIGEV